jgi:hypothetical protein
LNFISVVRAFKNAELTVIAIANSFGHILSANISLFFGKIGANLSSNHFLSVIQRR